MTASAFITGVSDVALTAAERAFVREARPWGLILFKRNIESPAQVAALVASFREAVGVEAPVLVDQEGGRVQRIGPPHWPSYPAAAVYGSLYEHDHTAGISAARLGARLIAHDLQRLGIDIDCLPVADLAVPDADPVIGDRAYGDTPVKVAALARAAAEGLMAGGVLPVLKHLPGHGHAAADSHLKLPVVEAARAELDATDFAAFRLLAGLPLGMTAHVVFCAYDPVNPATTSVTMVQDVIRDSIGFKGLLMSDDVSMGALSGSLAERTRAALAAGCDIVLHCNGELAEMEAVASAAPVLAGEAAARAAAALSARTPPDAIDEADARLAFAAMLAEVRVADARRAS
jgi:beta-N-acetylhexosaminidase